MSVNIRESVTVDPISTERLDIAGNIHRYNFGWVKTTRIVGGLIGDGEIVETSNTSIAGVTHQFLENVTQEILPPSLETPDVTANTIMVAPKTVASFQKVGIKKRAMVRARAVGNSELIIIGSQQFGIAEEKEYAQAVGSPSSAAVPDPAVAAGEGGMTISVANGVLTKTRIKG